MTSAIGMFVTSAALYALGAIVREIEVGGDGALARHWVGRSITALLVVSAAATVYLTLARLIAMAL